MITKYMPIRAAIANEILQLLGDLMLRLLIRPNLGRASVMASSFREISMFESLAGRDETELLHCKGRVICYGVWRLLKKALMPQYLLG